MANLPTAVPADGNLKVVFVPAIANTSAPTATELNAGTAVDLSCYITPDGFKPGGDQATVTDERLCSKQTFEQPGRKTRTLDALTYVYQPQATAAADNKAYDTLKEGTAGYIVARWGKDYSTTFAAADKVDIWPVTFGQQIKQPGGANEMLKIVQKVFVTNKVTDDAPVG